MSEHFKNDPACNTLLSAIIQYKLQHIITNQSINQVLFQTENVHST